MAGQMYGDKNRGWKIAAELVGEEQKRFHPSRRGADRDDVPIAHAVSGDCLKPNDLLLSRFRNTAQHAGGGRDFLK